MASRPRPLGWTYAEFARLPDDGNRYEVIAGELYVTPSPRWIHQRVAFRLGFLIERFLEEHGFGGFLSTGPIDVLFGEGDYLAPDLVFVRQEREAIVKPRGIEAAPDLVVEVVSDSTARRDRGIKRERYAHFGVPEYWVVDVEAQRVEVYRLNEPPRFETEVLTWRPVEDGPTLEIDLRRALKGLR